MNSVLAGSKSFDPQRSVNNGEAPAVPEGPPSVLAEADTAQSANPFVRVTAAAGALPPPLAAAGTAPSATAALAARSSTAAAPMVLTPTTAPASAMSTIAAGPAASRPGQMTLSSVSSPVPAERVAADTAPAQTVGPPGAPRTSVGSALAGPASMGQTTVMQMQAGVPPPSVAAVRPGASMRALSPAMRTPGPSFVYGGYPAARGGTVIVQQPHGVMVQSAAPTGAVVPSVHSAPITLAAAATAAVGGSGGATAVHRPGTTPAVVSSAAPGVVAAGGGRPA